VKKRLFENSYFNEMIVFYSLQKENLHQVVFIFIFYNWTKDTKIGMFLKGAKLFHLFFSYFSFSFLIILEVDEGILHHSYS